MSSWSYPGVLLLFLKLQDSSKVPPQVLEEWITQKIVPAVQDCYKEDFDGIWLYRAVDLEYNKPILLICEIENMDGVECGLRQNFSEGCTFDAHLPGAAGDHVEFDLRMYAGARTYGSSRQSTGKSDA